MLDEIDKKHNTINHIKNKLDFGNENLLNYYKERKSESDVSAKDVFDEWNNGLKDIYAAKDKIKHSKHYPSSKDIRSAVDNAKGEIYFANKKIGYDESFKNNPKIQFSQQYKDQVKSNSDLEKQNIKPVDNRYWFKGQEGAFNTNSLYKRRSSHDKKNTVLWGSQLPQVATEYSGNPVLGADNKDVYANIINNEKFQRAIKPYGKINIENNKNKE